MSTVIAPPPTSNFDAYRQCCAEQAALPPEQWTFKADSRYRRILEHVTTEQGEEFLQVAREAAGPRWEKVLERLPAIVAENDRYGQPLKASFPSVNLVCSPSNLRYLAHALLIWRHVEDLSLSAVHFVELGGGYGGLALYVYWLRGLFPWGGLTRTLVDLPEVLALQRVYAEALDLPLAFVNGLDGDALGAMFAYEKWATPYCISAYAFSEFDRETQDWYRERLVKKCQHGFMVWNFTRPLMDVAEKPLGGPLYPFVDAPLTVVPERPLTGPGNVVVTW